MNPSARVALATILIPLAWAASVTLLREHRRRLLLDAEDRARRAALPENVHKRSAYESQRQQEQLAHLTRVAKLGHLSAALAHELNQPLASILSNAQAAQHYLSQEPVDLDEVRAIIDDIVNSDKRAGELIRRLREMLRRGGTHAQQLDLKQVVSEALELSQADIASTRAQVSVSIPSDVHSVGADRVQVEQVFLNLLLNACEAMSQNPLCDRLIEIIAANEGEMVHVRVLDRGTGIPERDLESVFDAFYTTKRHGLGLGLAISRSIITAHGGQLWATPNKRRGSCLHFTLPILSPAWSREAAATGQELASQSWT